MEAGRDNSPWARLSELPLVVESYELDRLAAQLSYGFERVTTRIRLLGAGKEGLGEDVTPYEREDDTLHVIGPVLPLAGEWTLGSFCAHLAGLEQWPVPPRWEPMRRWRNWAFESAALDLALEQAGRALDEVIGRQPRPVRFVNSLGLGEPPTFDPIRRRLERHPGLRFKLDAAEWTPELIDELAATGAVEIVDFKGHYGLETGELPALLATYERVVATFPDALLEDGHDLPEVAELRAGGAADLLRRADPVRRRHRRDAVPPARRQRQAVPRRRPALAVRRLLRLRGARTDHVRRRNGRARRRPRSDPAARLAVPSRRTQRRGPERLQRGHAGARAPLEPAAAGPRADGLPPRGLNEIGPHRAPPRTCQNAPVALLTGGRIAGRRRG